MTKTLSITFVGSMLATSLLFALMPLMTSALSRTETRLNAALARPTTDQGSQSGQGGDTGTTGGQTSSNSTNGNSEEQADNANVNQDMAQAMFDALILNGPDTNQLPVGTDLNTDEVEDAVSTIPTNEAGSSFVSILHSIISRFTNR